LTPLNRYYYKSQKMNLKERISDLFEKYSVELAVEEKEEQVSLMATAVLESGQEIMTDADAFAVGVSVFVMNDENERIPLPDGDYLLEDGSTLVVAEGMVAEIKDAEAPAEEVVEEVVEEVEASADMITREDVASMIADAVAEAKKEFSSQLEERDNKITELSKQTTKTISRAPKMEAAKPVDLSKLSITERVAAIHNQFSL
jgi:ABC-type proline/glycine betaine transport system ATPase subunit